MLGNVGAVLNQIAQALTTGQIATAIGIIAFFAAGVMIIVGRRHLEALIPAVVGLLLIGSAATLAPMLLGGG